MAESADEEGGADDEGEHDHGRGHDGVAGDGGVLAGAEHDRGDEDDLDEHDRQCQHEGAVGVAEAVCEVFGLGDDAAGADDDDGHDRGEHQEQHWGGQVPAKERLGKEEGCECGPAEHDPEDHRRGKNGSQGGGVWHGDGLFCRVVPAHTRRCPGRPGSTFQPHYSSPHPDIRLLATVCGRTETSEPEWLLRSVPARPDVEPTDGVPGSGGAGAFDPAHQRGKPG